MLHAFLTLGVGTLTTKELLSVMNVIKLKVKWPRYRLGVVQRVGRCIDLLIHDIGTRRGWVVSSTPRSHFTPGKDPVPILQEAGWAPGQVWMGGKSRPHRDSIPDCPACSQSLYRLSYRAHNTGIWGSGDMAQFILNPETKQLWLVSFTSRERGPSNQQIGGQCPGAVWNK